ncbi:thioredoxin domain-containing protein [Arachnia rubra]|jgi:hypothetical protein|uniref:Thioredoxin n=1 Tax=Arachnia rubra TaxID=1547448 RepID=A0ABX7Y3N9_9ACTN|nr:thioredoxin domain-containing protein [Arachnia rubra]QUC07682.1 thioredoxin [Arachnia rubra]BCR81989.1 hypothetical protein SK1NUM_24320 [Arachnia rubra]
MKRILAPLAVAGVIVLAGCSQNASSDAMSPAMSPSGAMSPSAGMSTSPGDAMMTPSGYVSYEEYSAAMDKYSSVKVVLFFNATWCPDCQAITKALTDDPGKIPAKTTVVSVDYDSHTDLRQRYGVTMQHTFVQVDAQGMATRTWVSTSPNALLKELQG